MTHLNPYRLDPKDLNIERTDTGRVRLLDADGHEMGTLDVSLTDEQVRAAVALGNNWFRQGLAAGQAAQLAMTREALRIMGFGA